MRFIVLLAAIAIVSCTPSADTDASMVDATAADASPEADLSDAVDAATCRPDGSCPNDCLPADAPCWTCSWSFSVADCRCHATPVGEGCFVPDCSAPGPASSGDYCGTYQWCNRACAAGLTCRTAPDAGAGNFLTTCQP